MLIFADAFFALYSNFGLSGGAINYQNTSSTIKLLATVALLPLGLYLGLLFYEGGLNNQVQHLSVRVLRWEPTTSI